MIQWLENADGLHAHGTCPDCGKTVCEFVSVKARVWVRRRSVLRQRIMGHCHRNQVRKRESGAERRRRLRLCRCGHAYPDHRNFMGSVSDCRYCDCQGEIK